MNYLGGVHVDYIVSGCHEEWADMYVSIANARAQAPSKRGDPLRPAFTAEEKRLLKVDVVAVLEGALAEIEVAPSRWNGGPRAADLEALWTSGETRTKRLREAVRNRLESESTCPFCGMYRNPAGSRGGRLDVDHYLPKSKWPELALIPCNLVPMCDTCNSRLKHTSGPTATARSRVFLHPYYDEFVQQMGLVCTIQSSLPPSFRLETSSLSGRQRRVAESHFTKLNLSDRYGIHAVDQLLPDFHELVIMGIESGSIRDVAGIVAKASELFELNRRRRGRLDWRTATYWGLMQATSHHSTLLARLRAQVQAAGV